MHAFEIKLHVKLSLHCCTVVASTTVVIQLDVPVVYVEDYYQPLFISKYLFNLPQPTPPPYYIHIAGIFFTPTSNQTVPSNSFDNVTYNCKVDANRILIWEVNMIPLEGNDTVMHFEAKGVFKVDQGTNQSTLIITRDAREESSWQPISVRCSAFTRMPPQSDYSSFSYVITQYGKWMKMSPLRTFHTVQFFCT